MTAGAAAVGPGLHTCTVAGKERRLRVSLDAVREIETLTRQPFIRLALQLTDPLALRYGDAFLMFVELCAAGGTPLTEDERAALTVSVLLSEIVPVLTNALIAEGVLERTGSRAETDAKKKDQP